MVKTFTHFALKLSLYTVAIVMQLWGSSVCLDPRGGRVEYLVACRPKIYLCTDEGLMYNWIFFQGTPGLFNELQYVTY